MMDDTGDDQTEDANDGASGAPNPEADHIFAALGRLNRRADADIRRLATKEMTGLRGSHGRILDLIDRKGSRPSALADGAWITKQAISQRIRELENRGWVQVSPDPDDGRATLIRRTAQGDRVRSSALGAIATMEHEWAQLVGVERYDTFRQVLDELGTQAP